MCAAMSAAERPRANQEGAHTGLGFRVYGIRPPKTLTRMVFSGSSSMMVVSLDPLANHPPRTAVVLRH